MSALPILAARLAPAPSVTSRVGGGRRVVSRSALPLLLAGLAVGGCECGGDLIPTLPSMTVSPNPVVLSPPVGDRTDFAVTIENPGTTTLYVCEVSLSDDTDPAIEIVGVGAETEERENAADQTCRNVWRIEGGDTAAVTLAVRPLLVSTLEGTLLIRAEANTVPESEVTVPITVNSRDLGLPDIEVDPTSLEFDRIGMGDTVRATVQVKNVGVRDLVLVETRLVTEEENSPILLAVGVTPNWALAPQQTVTIDLVFAPQDTDLHEAVLEIESYDPDEQVVQVPVSGTGSICPTAVAVLLEDPEDIEPLDTLRLDGSGSMIGTPGTTLDVFEWQLEQRPVGSTAILFSPGSDRTEITADLAGDYQVRLRVYDSEQIRSCEDAIIRFTAKPTEDLHLQLVWDHPQADLDLHLLREGGTPFTHDGDAYFSNRMPNWFPANPESNPSLDADDDEGYGPENINIETPLPGSKWTVLVHYWNKQTDGDPYTLATLRLYAFGQQVLDLSQSFEEDETLWHAVEIEWGMTEGELPTLTQLGQVEAFPRPF